MIKLKILWFEPDFTNAKSKMFKEKEGWSSVSCEFWNIHHAFQSKERDRERGTREITLESGIPAGMCSVGKRDSRKIINFSSHSCKSPEQKRKLCTKWNMRKTGSAWKGTKKMRRALRCLFYHQTKYWQRGLFLVIFICCQKIFWQTAIRFKRKGSVFSSQIISY